MYCKVYASDAMYLVEIGEEDNVDKDKERKRMSECENARMGIQSQDPLFP